MQSASIRSGVRIADEGIYLSEDRYKQPKEQFKQIYECLDLANAPESFALCDVGCATGEFLYFIQSRKPGATLSGIDVSQSMLDQAKKQLPQASFNRVPIDEKNALPKQHYDIVTMIGVISIFDDITNAFENCLDALKPAGKLLVLSSFNPRPIDMITRYRRADQQEAPWELGWNVHSQATVEKLLKANSKVDSWSFNDFNMPFAIAPKDDPMRCWTMRVGDKEHFHVNGALMMVNLQMLLVQCK